MTPLTITIGDEPPLKDAPTLLLNTQQQQQQQQINVPAVEHVYEVEEEINNDMLNSTNRNDDSCATQPEQLFYHPQTPTANVSDAPLSTTINPEAQQSVWEPNQNQSVIDPKWVKANATGAAADESVAVSLDATNTTCKCVMCYHLFSSTKMCKMI